MHVILFLTALCVSSVGLYCGAAQAQEYRITSDFEGGNFGNVTKLSANHFAGEAETKLSEPKPMWYYFRIDGPAGNEVTVDVVNLGNIYGPRAGMKPVVSYDRKTWKRVEQTDWKSPVLSLRIPMKGRTAWVAFCFPYTYTDLRTYLQRLKDQSPSNVNVEILCRSRQGRDVFLVTITAGLEETGQKKGIWMTGRQHSGEVTGTFVLEGLIDFLVSDDPVARRMRKDFIFKVIPMVDVDGVANGCYGKDQVPKDFNRDWTKNPSIPTIQTLRTTISNWARDHSYQMFLDVHSPGACGENHIYTLPRNRCSHQYYDRQHQFMKLMEEYSPASNKIYARNYLEVRGVPGMAWVAEYTDHGVRAFIVEVTYQPTKLTGALPMSSLQEFPSPPVTILSLREYGEALCRAIGHFLGDAPHGESQETRDRPSSRHAKPTLLQPQGEMP